MTDIQIRECFGIASSAPDRVLRNDDEILQSIKNNIGFSKIFDDVRVNDVLQEIRQEIENNMESIIGKYDANTPEHDMPSRKIERNNGRQECLAIIDKHIKEIEE